MFSVNICRADTIDIDWIVDGQTYDSTTCNMGGDVTLPPTPSKTGYTFMGWQIDYTPIEYLESTGTQYIDTGIVPNINTKIRVKFSSTGTYSAGVVGVRASYNKNNISITTNNRTALVDFNNGSHETYRLTDYQYNMGSLVVAELSKDARIRYNPSDETTIIAQSTAVNSQTFNITQSALLFDANSNDCTPMTGYIYYTKIWDNDVLVRDFIPVLDSNGVACMFDKVTGQFFYNAGTGDFIAGPVINE